jgi:nucleotide-binding universal stress UspA family protein
METQILVPLDGSALAETVLPHAEALARANGYGLLLLHVVTPSETSQASVWIATAPAALRREWEESRLTQIHAYLTAVAARLQAVELQVRTEVLMDHDPAAAIVGRADRDLAVALIAIATHGRSGLSRWALGSVAAKVLHAATKPLLLWRAREASQAGIPTWPYRTILVPLDGSCFAEHALDPAQTIVAGSNAEVVLLAVAPVGGDIALDEIGGRPDWMQAERAAECEHLDQYLNQIADRLAVGGHHVHTRLAAGSPAEAILLASDQEHADLIVMTTHGRSGLSRLWLGSVAAKVAQGAQVPVLLVRPQEALEGEDQD